MKVKVYLTTETDHRRRGNNQALQAALEKAEVEFVLFPVLRHVLLPLKVASAQRLNEATAIFFPAPYTVDLCLTVLTKEILSEKKLVARDVATARLLCEKYALSALVPLLPADAVSLAQGERAVVLDGEIWPELLSVPDLALTETQSLKELPELEGAVVVLTEPRLALRLPLESLAAKTLFMCKNPECAEICWSAGCQVALPEDFTVEALVRELLVRQKQGQA